MWFPNDPNLRWACLAEDFESCLAENRIFKTLGALFLSHVSTQYALLRTWNTNTTGRIHLCFCMSVCAHCVYECLPSVRRSVMSSSREGMILSNILNFFPKRGIWRIRQEGTCNDKTIKYDDYHSTEKMCWENCPTEPSTGKISALNMGKHQFRSVLWLVSVEHLS